MIRYLSWLSIACVIGTFILVSTHNTAANLGGVVLIFIGAVLMLFLMGRAAVTRVRDTAREVENVVSLQHELQNELLKNDDGDATTPRT